MTAEMKEVIKTAFIATIHNFIQGNWGYDPNFVAGVIEEIYCYYTYEELEPHFDEMNTMIQNLIQTVKIEC